MRHFYFAFAVAFALFTLAGLMLGFGSSGCSAGEKVTSEQPPRDGAFAVLELFTSEGCSSCPPADRLLGEIAQDAQRRGVPIYPIAFHIDYWDGLGWKDRFSLAAATDRQQRYANALGSQVYTPQMVVNGQTQFVGSDEDTARSAIANALSEPSPTRLRLAMKSGAAGELSISFATVGAPQGSVLNLVVVQPTATTDVPRGENAGETLHHFNIARSIKTISLDAQSGDVSLKLPDGLDAKDAVVIGYVQNPQSLHIIAAARVEAAGRNNQ